MKEEGKGGGRWNILCHFVCLDRCLPRGSCDGSRFDMSSLHENDVSLRDYDYIPGCFVQTRLFRNGLFTGEGECLAAGRVQVQCIGPEAFPPLSESVAGGVFDSAEGGGVGFFIVTRGERVRAIGGERRTIYARSCGRRTLSNRGNGMAEARVTAVAAAEGHSLSLSHITHSLTYTHHIHTYTHTHIDSTAVRGDGLDVIGCFLSPAQWFMFTVCIVWYSTARGGRAE